MSSIAWSYHRPSTVAGPLGIHSVIFVVTLTRGGQKRSDQSEKYQKKDKGPKEDCVCTYQAPNMHHHDEEFVVFVGDGQLHLSPNLSDRPGPCAICRDKGN